MTASALLLWQLAAAVLVPVILLAGTRTTSAAGGTDAAACPVCEHQATPGAACPMHSEAASRGTQDGACALTSSNTADATVFSLLGAGGVLAAHVDMSVPLPVARMFLLPAHFPLDFSPAPSFPPPRA